MTKTPEIPATNHTRQTERAPVACSRCNAKKTRCDASQRMPCSKCAAVSADCVLIESQRGRYRRRTSVASRRATETTQNSGRKRPSAQARPSQSLAGGPAPSLNDNVTVAPPALATYTPLPPMESSRLWREDSPAHDSPSSNDRAEMLYAEIAAHGMSPSQAPITEKDETIFLGESFSLTYVVHDVLAPLLRTTTNYQKRLHFPYADEGSPATKSGKDAIHEQIQFLGQQGLFFMPSPAVLEQLFNIYHTDFHPAYPLIDWHEFLRLSNADELSLLVTMGVLMIAVTICDDRILVRAGFSDRQTARATFHKQARALFDADVEPDKTQVIRGVFLMSFWWSGPNEQKDTWHYLGIAIGLAQSLGMHRSTKLSHMHEGTTRSWKCIWWSLRTRDVLVSGSIGRPQHIRETDCDIPMLQPEDVREEDNPEDKERIHYASEVAKLSTIFSEIISSRYGVHSPSSGGAHRKRFEESLSQFRQQIPQELVYRGIDTASGKGIWAAMLVMAFNYCMILLSRPPQSTCGRDEKSEWGNVAKALAAATETTRVMEDMLSCSMGRLCQIHTIPALFNALAIHVYSMCTSETLGRELAENRARICMLGLASLQKSWPVGGWVLQLFVSITKKLHGLQNRRNKNSNMAGARVLQDRQAPEGLGVQTSTIRFQEISSSAIQGSGPDQATRGTRNGSTTTVGGGVNEPEASSSDLPQPHEIGPHTKTSSSVVPHLFFLDDPLDGHSLDQDGFFDLLDVPYWQDQDGMDYTFSF